MKNYLIIGASSGIGRALAAQMAESGHRVFGTHHAKGPEAVPDGVEAHLLDVLGEEWSFGYLPEVLDGLVYCPGGITLKPFHRFSPEHFLADYQLQVVGAVKALQAVLPKLKNAEQASVLLFSTVAVQLGLPFHALVSASKGAVEGLTRALAAEYAPKIRVNAIAPSLTDTPMAAGLLSSEEKRAANAQRHPLKRIGLPEDVARMAAFLMGSEAGWITGQVFHVDGGMSTLRI